MNETMGGLIQMTAHSVVTSEARAMIVWGCVLAAVCAVLAVAAALSRKRRHRWRYVAFFAALAVAGAIVAGSGAGQPRQKLLYCCAEGPVSLEAIAAKYDIIEVDGKLLMLAER